MHGHMNIRKKPKTYFVLNIHICVQVTSRKMLLSRVTDMEVEEDEFRTGGWML
jgi:hypothetical protein